jgi:hypothetical protein
VAKTKIKGRTYKEWLELVGKIVAKQGLDIDCCFDWPSHLEWQMGATPQQGARVCLKHQREQF